MSNAVSESSPRAIIVAGPNGAGKTTFACEFLPAEGNCPTFINADLIAEGLSPFQPEAMAIEASRLMLERVRQMVAKREDFAIETTLAGKAYLRMIREWKELGYQVKIIFLKLDSPEMAIARVQHRVRMGGHNIPEPVIRRRYARGWENFQNRYKTLADSWQVYNAMKTPPVLMEEGGEE
jgi:predicted ABC-type ATPase